MRSTARATRSGSSGSGAASGRPGRDRAVAAGARADVAEDLERRRAASPALADVRAASLLADRVQTGVAHDPSELRVADRWATAPAPSSTAGADALELRPGHGRPPSPAAARARGRAPRTAAGRAGRARRPSSPASPVSRAIDVNGGVAEPAGVEQVVDAEVEIDVQGEPVARHPARAANADRGDLPVVDPDAAGVRRIERVCPSSPKSASVAIGRLLERPARSGAGRGRALPGRGSGSRRAGPGRGRSSGRRG